MPRATRVKRRQSTPKKPGWRVTWTPSTAKSIGGRIVPSEPERRDFPDQQTSVCFVMEELDERYRGMARLYTPDGHLVAEFSGIEQMYANYKEAQQ